MLDSATLSFINKNSVTNNMIVEFVSSSGTTKYTGHAANSKVKIQSVSGSTASGHIIGVPLVSPSISQFLPTSSLSPTAMRTRSSMNTGPRLDLQERLARALLVLTMALLTTRPASASKEVVLVMVLLVS